MSEQPTRILIADDDLTFLDGISKMLRDEPNIWITAAVTNGRRAIEAYEKYQPDLALLDVEMPVMDGITAARHIVDAHPNARIIMLTAMTRPEFLTEALEAGARGYLTKDILITDLPRKLDQALHGAVPLTPQSATWLADAFLERNGSPAVEQEDPAFELALMELPERYKPIVRRVAQGCSTQEIADQLDMSARTVRTYISEVLKATDTPTRTRFVAKCLKVNIIEVLGEED